MSGYRRMRTDYRICARCGASLDPGEGMRYPGNGTVCRECGEELDREAEFRKAWGVSGEFLEGLKAEGVYSYCLPMR